jgi:hypothetical protein
MRTWIAARVSTKFCFFLCDNMPQSGRSIERSLISSVKITKAAQWPQTEGSPGRGFVVRLTDQFNECQHSGQFHFWALRWGIRNRKSGNRLLWMESLILLRRSNHLGQEASQELTRQGGNGRRGAESSIIPFRRSNEDFSSAALTGIHAMCSAVSLPRGIASNSSQSLCA